MRVTLISLELSSWEIKESRFIFLSVKWSAADVQAPTRRFSVDRKFDMWAFLWLIESRKTQK